MVEVLIANRITVHRRNVRARRIHLRDHGAGEDPAGGAGDRHTLGAERLRGRADELDRFVEADHVRCQSPDLPPVFDTTSIPPIVIVLSIALSISNKVRHATETAVNASISTPVTARVPTSDVSRKPGSCSSISIRTSTLVSGSGWHKGMRSAVRFAAMIPASSAVWITDPLGAVPARTLSSVSARQQRSPRALAVRTVASFSDTS